MGYRPESIFVLFILMNIVIQFVSWIILHKLVPVFSIVNYIRQVVLPLCIIIVLSFVLPFVAHVGMEVGFLRFCVVTLLSFFSIVIMGYFIVLNRDERTMVMGFINKIKR